jgi:hypothetical protein
MWHLTDEEIDLLVQAFINPPPAGFTEYERKQWLDYIKNPSPFDRMPAHMPTPQRIFTYEVTDANKG